MHRPEPQPSLLLTLDAAQTVPIASLAEARAKVSAFIQARHVEPWSYLDSTGRIERDGKPYARVSYHGRLWALDEQGRETFRAMTDSGEVAP